jgi:hypothetical protein
LRSSKTMPPAHCTGSRGVTYLVWMVTGAAPAMTAVRTVRTPTRRVLVLGALTVEECT